METFNFTNDIILEDERVLLRPLKESDIDNLLPFSLQEPEIWKYSLVQAGGGEENLKRYIDMALNSRLQEKEYPFIVFDKQQNQYAGSTRFYDIQLANRSLQLGYTWYGKKFQGTGLNKHCKYLLLNFAFGTMQMERVEFRADNENARSIQAMKNIGCSVEGIIRKSSYRPDGSRRDSILLSILKDEWNDGLKEQLYLKLT